ncbi:hypothetical protein J6590_059017 [Homalodisca vitripennis]|nr:hypothetical protein J6590_059017 [Homalodisca vitripennis]
MADGQTDRRDHAMSLPMRNEDIPGCEMVCPDVLQLLNFKTPSSTRSNDLFIRQHYGTNYAANSTVARLQRAGNNLPITVDLFHDGVRSLKWKVKGAVLPT